MGSADITLDDNVPLPVPEPSWGIAPLPQGQVRISNFRPAQQYKTWNNLEHARIALSYLVKHETEGWRFKIVQAPTYGRFCILATDGWGKEQGFI